jgi:hypothetical protein
MVDKLDWPWKPFLLEKPEKPISEIKLKVWLCSAIDAWKKGKDTPHPPAGFEALKTINADAVGRASE